jgi:hypothetical protein
MTQKAVTLKFAVPAFGIIISIGIVYLTGKYPVPVVQVDANHSVAGSRDVAELPPQRLSRVHLLLSKW